MAIEYGYSKHSTVWKALGQNKFVKILRSQQETLYQNFTISMLQELKVNRIVRRYCGATDNHCVAHDDFLEHGN